MCYLNSAESFSNETIPFDCLPVQVLETTETFYIQYAISACVLNVFFSCLEKIGPLASSSSK